MGNLGQSPSEFHSGWTAADNYETQHRLWLLSGNDFFLGQLKGEQHAATYLKRIFHGF